MSGGNQAQAFTTTPAQLTCFSTNPSGGAGQYGANQEGDPSVIPDPANNRIKLLAPGVYQVSLTMSQLGAGAGDFLVQLRKNVAGVMTIQPELSGEWTGLAATGRTTVAFTGLLNVVATDRPTGAAFAAFGAPSGTFTGGAGAPQVLTSIDLVVSTIAGSLSSTVEYANLSVLRLE
jgi:hypothetical protein